jgi:hypothetical protein
VSPPGSEAVDRCNPPAGVRAPWRRGAASAPVPGAGWLTTRCAAGARATGASPR